MDIDGLRANYQEFCDLSLQRKMADKATRIIWTVTRSYATIKTDRSA